MYQAKLLKLDNLIEEKVVMEINGLEIVGFTSICPYLIEPGKLYPINIGLTILDDPEIVQINESKYELKRIDETFGYFLYGKVYGDVIDIGNNIKIQDDIFNENSYLDGQFIRMKVDRLAIEFI